MTGEVVLGEQCDVLRWAHKALGQAELATAAERKFEQARKVRESKLGTNG